MPSVAAMPGWIVTALAALSTGISVLIARSVLTGRWTQKVEDRVEAVEKAVGLKADADNVYTKAEQLEREKEIEKGYVPNRVFDGEVKRIDRLEKKVFNGGPRE